ncbi:hypothetical protein UP17_11595 [Peribacillus simplex]|nr:hypothetical protein UP17_11595 [Peribacillus simplex]
MIFNGKPAYTIQNKGIGRVFQDMNKKPERVNIPAPSASPSEKRIHKENADLLKLLQRLKAKRWIFLR